MFTQSRPSKRSSRVLRRTVLTELANLKDKTAIGRLRRTLRSIDFESEQDVIELRDELRGIWLDASHRADKILDKWLGWRPSPNFFQLSYMLRGLRESGKGSGISLSTDERADLEAYLGQSEADHLAGFMAFRCSIQAHKLVPDGRKLRSNLIQGVLEHWQHFRFCTNPDCAAPYFIAKRSDQTICDAGDCKAQKQRQHALKWWRENRAKNSSDETAKGK
jgi:hypothetical protein